MGWLQRRRIPPGRALLCSAFPSPSPRLGGEAKDEGPFFSNSVLQTVCSSREGLLHTDHRPDARAHGAVVVEHRERPHGCGERATQPPPPASTPSVFFPETVWPARVTLGPLRGCARLPPDHCTATGGNVENAAEMHRCDGSV